MNIFNLIRNNEIINPVKDEPVVINLDFNKEINYKFEDSFLIELNDVSVENNIKYLETIKDNILNNNMSLPFALNFYKDLNKIITTDMDNESISETMDEYISKSKLQNMLSITNRFVDNDEIINILDLDISKEADESKMSKFLKSINIKKRIEGLINKINKTDSGKTTINKGRINKWIENKIPKIEPKVNVSVKNPILTTVGIATIFTITVSVLIWIYRLIRKDMNRKKELETKQKEDKISIGTNDLNKKINVLSKRDIDRYINLWRKMIDNLIEISKDDKIIIKESPKDFVKRIYGLYLKEFNLIIQNKTPNKKNGYKFYSSNKYKIIEIPKSKRKEKTLKEHGYDENDYDRYKDMRYSNFSKTKEVSYIRKIIDNIEFALNNPEHIKLMVDLCGEVELILNYEVSHLLNNLQGSKS